MADSAVQSLIGIVKSQKTGVWGWHVDDSENRLAPTLELDRYEFAECAIESYQIRRVLCQLQNTHDVLGISYEDIILEGDLPTYDPLFEFVGVEPVRADWLTDRKLSPPPESYIENYRQLKVLQEKSLGILKKEKIRKAYVLHTRSHLPRYSSERQLLGSASRICYVSDGASSA